MTTPMTENPSAFSEVIVTLEREAEDLERRAAKLRAMAKDLREVAVAPVTFTRPALTGPATKPVVQLSFTATNQSPRHAAPIVPRRMPTSVLILETIRAAEGGITFDALCERVVPRIESKAANKRKLVHSTLSYLKNTTKDIREDDHGFLFLNNQPTEGA